MKQEEIIKIIGRDCLDSINSRLHILKLVDLELGNEGDENQLPEKRKLVFSYDINPQNPRAEEYNKFYQDIQRNIVEIICDYKDKNQIEIDYPYLDNYLDAMYVEPEGQNPIKVSPEVFDLFAVLVSELNHDIKILNSNQVQKLSKAIFDKICKNFYGNVKIVK